MIEKTIEEMYVKMEQKEHILKLPDTYIGSIEKVRTTMWVLDERTASFIKKEVEFIPAFYKIFDEVLVNAYDQFIRISDKKDTETRKYKRVKTIRVSIENDTISVFNCLGWCFGRDESVGMGTRP